jgi:hypothetical protein
MRERGRNTTHAFDDRNCTWAALAAANPSAAGCSAAGCFLPDNGCISTLLTGVHGRLRALRGVRAADADADADGGAALEVEAGVRLACAGVAGGRCAALGVEATLADGAIFGVALEEGGGVRWLSSRVGRSRLLLLPASSAGARCENLGLLLTSGVCKGSASPSNSFLRTALLL